MANTRVKVKRTTLIEKLEEARKAEVERYRKEKEAYDQKKEKHLTDLIAGVENWLTLAQSNPDKALKEVGYGRSYGSDGNTKYFSTIHIHTVEYPKEVPQAYVGHIDRMLKILKASEDETISVSTEDDYAKYL